MKREVGMCMASRLVHATAQKSASIPPDAPRLQFSVQEKFRRNGFTELENREKSWLKFFLATICRAL